MPSNLTHLQILLLALALMMLHVLADLDGLDLHSRALHLRDVNQALITPHIGASHD